jgi:hypothetical protein
MKRAPWLLLAVLLLSCAGSPPGDAPTRPRNSISADEIAGVSAETAMEVIRRLRPEYLRSRGSQSLQSSGPVYPVVYAGGVRLGGLEQLRFIQSTDVEAIRFIVASDATTLWGTGHSGGVIEVVLKAGGRPRND